MRLADKVQEWLDAKEWEDEIQRNEEDQVSQMQCNYGINNQQFRLYIETTEKKDWIEVYLYAPIKVADKKKAESAILFNYINSRISIGAVHFTPDGNIRFRHVIDVEDSEPSIKMIDNMLGSAVLFFENWFEEISAVALTKITAQQVIDDLEKDDDEEDEEVPDEI